VIEKVDSVDYQVDKVESSKLRKEVEDSWVDTNGTEVQ
jgi:hypothetical protein